MRQTNYSVSLAEVVYQIDCQNCGKTFYAKVEPKADGHVLTATEVLEYVSREKCGWHTVEALMEVH